VGDQWGRKRLEAEKSIEKQYGKSKRELEKRLQQLTQKIEQGNWVTRIIDRMQGGDVEREALQKGLANIEQRSQEIRGEVESQRLASFEALEKSHRKQNIDLEQKIEKGGEKTVMKFRAGQLDLSVNQPMIEAAMLKAWQRHDAGRCAGCRTLQAGWNRE
jgi:hypothetical protein